VKSPINHPDVNEKDIELSKSYLNKFNKGLKKIMVS